MVTRGKLLAGTRKGAVAEHDQVSEAYRVIDGAATLLTGPDLVNPVKRGNNEKTVRLQNGPGWSADGINHPQVHHLNPGDVIIIPRGPAICSLKSPTTSSILWSGSIRTRQCPQRARLNPKPISRPRNSGNLIVS